MECDARYLRLETCERSSSPRYRWPVGRKPNCNRFPEDLYWRAVQKSAWERKVRVDDSVQPSETREKSRNLWRESGLQLETHVPKAVEPDGLHGIALQGFIHHFGEILPKSLELRIFQLLGGHQSCGD